jgi:D-arginine dehydrogenase
VALIAHRIEHMTTLPVKRIRSKWAGLRTFSPDRSLVAGWASDAENFFWLAGQGGYGIQTAPAMALCCKSLIFDKRLPANLSILGVAPSNLSPRRFDANPSTAPN